MSGNVTVELGSIGTDNRPGVRVTCGDMTLFLDEYEAKRVAEAILSQAGNRYFVEPISVPLNHGYLAPRLHTMNVCVRQCDFQVMPLSGVDAMGVRLEMGTFIVGEMLIADARILASALLHVQQNAYARRPFNYTMTFTGDGKDIHLPRFQITTK